MAKRSPKTTKPAPTSAVAVLVPQKLPTPPLHLGDLVVTHVDTGGRDGVVWVPGELRTEPILLSSGYWAARAATPGDQCGANWEPVLLSPVARRGLTTPRTEIADSEQASPPYPHRPWPATPDEWSELGPAPEW